MACARESRAFVRKHAVRLWKRTWFMQGLIGGFITGTLLVLVSTSTTVYADAWTDRLETGNKAAAAGKYDSAMATYSSLVDERPAAKVDVELRMADCCRLKKDFERAVGICRKVASEDTKRAAEAVGLIGNCYVDQGRLSDGHAQYEKAIKACKTPQDEWLVKDISFRLGGSYVTQNLTDAALAHYEAMTRDNPKDMRVCLQIANCLRRKGQCDKAAAKLQGGLDATARENVGDDRQRSELEWAIGDCLRESKQWGKAITYYDSLAAERPTDYARAQLMIAGCLAEQQRSAAELAALQKGLTAVGDAGRSADWAARELRFAITKHYARARDWDRAVAVFQEIERQQPQDAPRARLECAEFYLAKGDHAKAVSAFQSLTTDFPDAPQVAGAALGIANAYRLEGKAKEAINQLDKVSEKYADHRLQALLTQASIYFNDLHDYENTVHTFKQLPQVAVSEQLMVDETAWRMASSLKAQKKYDQAAGILRVAASAASSPDAKAERIHSWVGDMYLSTKEYEKALAAYIDEGRQVGVSDDVKARSLYSAYTCQKEMGQDQVALRNLERLVNAYPKCSYVKDARRVLYNAGIATSASGG